MEEELFEIWKEVLKRINHDWGQDSFDMWMWGTRPITADDGVFVVEFPNTFTRDWVQSRHHADLEATIQQITGETVAVRLTVARQNDAAETNGSGPEEEAPVPQPARRLEGQGSLPFSSQNGAKGGFSGGILNPRYTFDTFVVGSSNRFAHAASLAVAEAPARAYNPLFLYGGVGLGKTHLMQAIGHYVLEHYKDKKVVYVSSEKFTNELINAIGRKSMVQFRNKYRTVDVLLIDDIQFVAGKESTQEEFFHTFNALHEANKQIVISSDRPPKEIPTLEERLRSRFEWGLTTDIQAPDLETRIAILRRKAANEGLHVANDALVYIARQIQSNIRELEGALIRVMAYSNLHDREVDADFAAEALKDIIPSQRSIRVTIGGIQDTVSSHFGLRTQDMKTKRRTRAVAFPRQIAMYLAREMTDSSLPKIGEEFGGRDHTTVLHACEKIRTALRTDPSLAATVNDLKQKVQKG